MAGAREARCRRLANRDGLAVTKFRDGDHNYDHYGPYALVDRNTNTLIAWGLDLGALESELVS